jgi:hypothetical protein
MRNDLYLSITLLGDLNGVTEVSGAAIDLDAIVEEFLEGGEIEDFVIDGLRGIDDELDYTIRIRFDQHIERRARITFLVILVPFLPFAPAADFCSVVSLLLVTNSKAVYERMVEPFYRI